MSLALEMCSIAERHVPEDELHQIVAVGVEIGDEAGVEADNLVFWLETLLANPPFRDARPVVDHVSGDVLRVTYLEVDDGRPDH
jgi:Zn finger protein HypA/HybF involved in hydrogenase expression